MEGEGEGTGRIFGGFVAKAREGGALSVAHESCPKSPKAWIFIGPKRDITD